MAGFSLSARSEVADANLSEDSSATDTADCLVIEAVGRCAEPLLSDKLSTGGRGPCLSGEDSLDSLTKGTVPAWTDGIPFELAMSSGVEMDAVLFK